MTNELTLSYFAGLIDGEGTIRINRMKNRKNPHWKDLFNAQVCLGMTVKTSVEALYNEFGGSFYEEERKGVRKKMYRWNCTGNNKIPPILEQLIPYLVVKKEQARVVLEFCKTRKRSKTNETSEEEYKMREDYYYKLRELNK